MNNPGNSIAHFNRAEAVIWFLAALALPWVVRSVSRKQRVAVYCACFGFILFGITDLLEAERIGAIPGWLWAAKIGCGGLLLSCRIIHIGWENFGYNDRWLLFGLLCLSATVALIIFG